MAVEGINVALLSVNKKVGVPMGTSTSMILIFCCFFRIFQITDRCWQGISLLP